MCNLFSNHGLLRKHTSTELFASSLVVIESREARFHHQVNGGVEKGARRDEPHLGKSMT